MRPLALPLAALALALVAAQQPIDPPAIASTAAPSPVAAVAGRYNGTTGVPTGTAGIAHTTRVAATSARIHFTSRAAAANVPQGPSSVALPAGVIAAIVLGVVVGILLVVVTVLAVMLRHARRRAAYAEDMALDPGSRTAHPPTPPLPAYEEKSRRVPV